ncbi:hypothetical protein [Aminicella lysinilytica]|uniref:Uncharacterized protein n=1 Tax=Aminicella lysinilytica TaxID=433323 RepID=A0A4R6Q269_9FIRM|nr:hypothetical protein [Aminicella lysinilytica]NLD11611.1 hypothetical protein [Clostridiales bacterium]TDP56338.1 hypothetical protein EV211_1161 [Aminicella lysinilytica]
MDIIKTINVELEDEKIFLSDFNRDLKTAPQGMLKTNMKNGRPYYSQRFPGGRPPTYLGKKDVDKINALKAKRFCQEAVKVFENNIPILEQAVKGLQPYTPDDIIARMPAGLTTFPDECYNALDLLNAKHWEKTPYEVSHDYPQDLIHRTRKGDIVRSKNEVNICDALLYYGIPYHYEQPLRLFGRDVHPDIVAYSEYYRRLIYWEHAGLASDMSYVHANMPKYLDYLQSGIVPWRNLIITFDDEKGGLDSSIIDKIIHLWFLGE